MADAEHAARVWGAGAHPQDRAANFERGNVLTGVVADGAGGNSGGAAVATLVVEAVGGAVETAHNMLDPMAWRQLLLNAGMHLESRGIGQTTAVVIATDGTRIAGAAFGDSGAWLIQRESVVDLTMGQPRKPLLGGRPRRAAPRHRHARTRRSLLLATDGLLKYATAERICECARRGLPAEEACDELVRAVRLPSGSLQDDVGIVLIRAAQT